MKHKTTFRLHKYWTDLRGERSAPQRTEVEPGDIRDVLAETFILNANSDRDFRFRLAGSRVCALYCRELKQKDYLAFWGGSDLSALNTVMEAIREDAAAAVIGWEGRNLRGQSLLLETVLLPLQTEGGGYNRILGSMAALDKPYWLGVHPIIEQSIVSLRMIWPNETRGLTAGTALPEDGNAAARDATPPIAVNPQTGQMAKRFGHLLVYDGGKTAEAADISA